MKIRILLTAAAMIFAVVVSRLLLPSPNPREPRAQPAIPASFSDEIATVAPVATEDADAAPSEPVPYAEGRADKRLRNADFPRTYIRAIHVGLTSPKHGVELVWDGPNADRMETGPFHSSPGAGLGFNNCDDVDESNRDGSNCTPKGTFVVEGFSDHLRSYPRCQFVTWIHIPRAVAFHYHWQLPNYPASHGCVRLERHAAQLIHNNSIAGTTEVTIDGNWSRRGRY
jgi:hypothetical protein